MILQDRVFDVACNDDKLRRRIEITIEKVDFEHDGVPHSLQFHWVVEGGKGRGINMHYAYGPGKAWSPWTKTIGDGQEMRGYSPHRPRIHGRIRPY
jgi:hypothetical protein